MSSSTQSSANHTASEPGGTSTRLENWCNRLAHAALPGDYALLDAAGLFSGHPWAFLAQIALADPGSVAYYRYLYGLARLADPAHILEVGTAFGLSAACFIQGSPNLRKLISLDLGVFSQQYDVVELAEGRGWSEMEKYKEMPLVADGRNLAFAQQALQGLLHRIGSRAELSLYRVNTQPEGSDNFGVRVDVPRWGDVPELVAELEHTPIDLLFIDGKHTDDGLYQDFKSFFPYVKPGGIVLCDDLHDASFPYPWAGQTLACFERVRAEFAGEIEDSFIWGFPQLPDWYGQEPLARPMGLIRKRGAPRPAGSFPVPRRPLLPHEVEPLAVGADQIVAHLRFIARHSELLGEMENMGVSDRESAGRLRFVKDHSSLFVELEGLGLADTAAQRLRFVKEHSKLLAELENLGLSERTVEILRFTGEHPRVFERLRRLLRAWHRV